MKKIRTKRIAALLMAISMCVCASACKKEELLTLDSVEGHEIVHTNYGKLTNPINCVDIAKYHNVFESKDTITYEAKVHYFAKEEGGWSVEVCNYFRPVIAIGDSACIGVMNHPKKKSAKPGSQIDVTIDMMYDDDVSIEVGQKFLVLEGHFKNREDDNIPDDWESPMRIVGVGEVVECD